MVACIEQVLPVARAATALPIQAVGRLSIGQAIQTPKMGAQIVVFGAPLIISGTEFKAAGPDFEPILREIVGRVHAIDL